MPWDDWIYTSTGHTSSWLCTEISEWRAVMNWRHAIMSSMMEHIFIPFLLSHISIHTYKHTKARIYRPLYPFGQWIVLFTPKYLTLENIDPFVSLVLTQCTCDLDENLVTRGQRTRASGTFPGHHIPFLGSFLQRKCTKKWQIKWNWTQDGCPPEV